MAGKAFTISCAQCAFVLIAFSLLLLLSFFKTLTLNAVSRLYNSENHGPWEKNAYMEQGSIEQFDLNRLVRCLDNLNTANKNQQQASRKYHIAFVGDSRIRQLYSRLAESIPKYDRVDDPYIGSNLDLYIFHKDIRTTSNLLRIVFSFHWENLLLDNEQHYVKDLLEKWRHQETQPDIIILGIATHHMLKRHANFEKKYFEEVKRLAPFLGGFRMDSKVIWLNQFPLRDSGQSDVNADKIKHYNSKVNPILRSSGINVWNSGDQVVNEYLRSCLLNVRDDDGYLACLDSLHPGTVVIGELIQLLINEICL